MTSSHFSFDIKRTNVDASAAATAGVYSGFWIYYNLYGADGTTVSTTGRGFYMRTSDANFAATDSDWVHMTYGVYNFSGYNPISVAYAYIGTIAQKGCTGRVPQLQGRNIKHLDRLECRARGHLRSIQPHEQC